MLLGRMEGMLGKAPGQYRAAPVFKRRRLRPNITNAVRQEPEDFYGTANYAVETNDQARKREVARLFARMRSELMDIAHEFADESESAGTCTLPVRQGMFIEMMIASEFVADELDAVIAGLCLKGIEAEKQGNQERLNEVCKIAATYSRLRNRISEFQRELDSMVALTTHTMHRYEFSCSLNFDPIAEGHDSNSFVNLYLKAVDEVVTALTELSAMALQKRDFETVAELCSCNIQLSNFLGDSMAILSEVSVSASQIDG